jgi:hypothetical protein
MIDLKRRGFIFGATAALVVPAPKSFFIVKPPPLIVAPPTTGPLFDLPMQQVLDLMKKLDAFEIEPGAIPRWVWLRESDYDRLVRGTA